MGVRVPRFLAHKKPPHRRSCVSVTSKNDNATFVVVAKSNFNMNLPFQ